MQWLDDLAENEHLSDDYVVRVRVHGAEYGAQSATLAEIVDDMLPLPVLLLRTDRPEAGNTAERAVDDADQVSSCLWKLAENLAQAAGAEPKSGAGDRARESLYAALEAPYRSWLTTLRPGRDLTEARTEWQTIIRGVCRPITDELINAAPNTAWSGRKLNNRLVNVPLAEAWFIAALRNTLPLAFQGQHNAQLEITR